MAPPPLQAAPVPPQPQPQHPPLWGEPTRTTATTDTNAPTDFLHTASVGVMADVCKLARADGGTNHAPYTPLNPDFLAHKTLPSVEPARLEIRVAEFYRQASLMS